MVKTFDLKDYYRRLSLIDLVRKIVENSDLLALEEFHENRTIFRVWHGEKRDLHFVEFLDALCKGPRKIKALVVMVINLPN